MVKNKSKQLQIRVTTAQKAALKRLARRAGMDVSNYVLSTVLPTAKGRFREVVRALHDEENRRFALAELNDLLTTAVPARFHEAVDGIDFEGLSPVMQNYVAAMVERASHMKGVAPPAWVRRVEPLEKPYFAAPFPRLRPYLLRVSPVAFKRRNIFIDSGLGDRV